MLHKQGADFEMYVVLVRRVGGKTLPDRIKMRVLVLKQDTVLDVVKAKQMAWCEEAGADE